MQVNTNNLTSSTATIPQDVGETGGVSEPHWYVAIVNHNTEKAVAERLKKNGYETYVATQPDYRIWANGKRAKIDRVVIPSTIFIHCTGQQRLQALRVPGVNRFLTDRGRKQGDGPAPPAVIPPVQLRKLRFMLGNSETPVGFISRPLQVGTRVRVIRGRLRGLEGEVLRASKSPSPTTATSPEQPRETDLLVSLDILGCARVTISPLDLESLD